MQINQEFSLSREIARKGVHLLILLLPISYQVFGRWNALKIIAPIAILVIFFDYLRRKSDKIKFIFNKIFGQVLRQKEIDGSFCGASWMLFAAILIFLFAKKEIAIISFLLLAICDLSASLIGKSISSRPFFEKSLAGSSAFFLSGILVLIAAGSALQVGFWFYFFSIFSLFTVTILEARPSFFNVDDNFIIPFGYALIMTMMDIIWGIL